MQISSVNFGSGLLYHKGQYINPEQVKKFKPYESDKSKTRIIYSDKNANDIIPVNADYFALAWVNAKNSEDVITLDGDKQ